MIPFIKEGDVIPKGFYIKTGALPRPQDFRWSDTATKFGNDGLPENHVRTYDPYMSFFRVEWVTFGYKCRWFHVRLRFKDASKIGGKSTFFSFEKAK